MLKKSFNFLSKICLEEINSLFLFIPVLMGTGAYIYLKYFFQNYSIIPIAILFTFIIISLLLRKKSYVNIINIAIIALSLGICSAQLKTKLNHFSMLQGENIPHYVEGSVDKIIKKANGTSIIVKLKHESLQDLEINKLEGTSKVSVKLTSKSSIPNKGDDIYLKAILNSPTPSVMRGAYDFKKDSYFKQIGAFGYATTKLYFIEKSSISILDKLQNKVRKDIDNIASNKINSQLMKALMLGEKKAIPKETVENFRASGISHLLSISGLHIGLIFGFIFLLLRYLIAFSQSITLKHDIKRMCAFISIIITFLYVMLVGFPMPAVRAFIMIFIVFLGIIFNRRAISMRNVAIAGIIILLISPNSILSASFQMSFAAVIALVKAYETISNRNIALIGFKGYFLGIIFTSIIAIIATAPFAIYNFQNFSPYGVITNTAVMPIISFIIMPFIVLSYILLPLGLSALPLTVINIAIEWVADIANYIANIKHSYLLISPPPLISMTLFIFAGLIICLFKHKLRLLGGVLLIIALITGFTHKDRPDIIISPNKKVIAVRNQDGLLTFENINKEQFITGIMIKINGQTEVIPFNNNQYISCDENKCIYNKDGIVIDLKNIKLRPNYQQIYIKNYLNNPS